LASKGYQLEIVFLLKSLGANSSILDGHGRLYSSYLPSLIPGHSKTCRFTTGVGTDEEGHIGNSSAFSHTLNQISSSRVPISKAVRELLKR